MIIASQLATLDDINKVEDDKNEDYLGLEATMDIYKEILEETLDGKKTITELIHEFGYDNMYLLKISCFFPDDKCEYLLGHGKGHLYYIFYSDQTPDAGIHGFITDNDYKILTIPDKFIWDKDYNNLDNTDISEEDLCDNTTETNTIFINKILKYFHSHYEAERRIDKNGDEILHNTNEYWKYFTLVYTDEKDEKNYTAFNKNDKRIIGLISELVFSGIPNPYYPNTSTYRSFTKNKCPFNNFEKDINKKLFTIGLWDDNTMDNCNIDDSGYYMYEFIIEGTDLILKNHEMWFEDDTEYDDHNIKNIYKELWILIKTDYKINQWIVKFVENIYNYLFNRLEYLCENCHKLRDKDEVKKNCDSCNKWLCETCSNIIHDSRARDT